MIEKPDGEPSDSRKRLVEFEALWGQADAIWTEGDSTPAFEGYVSADYFAVYESLLPLQNQGLNFLEWGSGLGIVAIMASRMGFNAYGIEFESELVLLAESLATKFGSTAHFATGSFIPDDFQWDVPEGDGTERTNVDSRAAYDELGMDLRDFDLIYAYPWPTEHQLFRKIVREHGRADSILMTFDVREGVELVRFD